jgi:hypothetical protein
MIILFIYIMCLLEGELEEENLDTVEYLNRVIGR